MLERLVRADEKETGEGMGRAKVDHEEAGERVEEEEKEMEGAKGWDDRNTSEGEKGKSFDRKANGGKKGKLH